MRKLLPLLLLAAPVWAQPKVSPEKEASMKADLVGQIDAMKKQAQVMVDSVFSFGELGFQEFETSRYLSGILEKEGPIQLSNVLLVCPSCNKHARVGHKEMPDGTKARICRRCGTTLEK